MLKYGYKISTISLNVWVSTGVLARLWKSVLRSLQSPKVGYVIVEVKVT